MWLYRMSSLNKILPCLQEVPSINNQSQGLSTQYDLLLVAVLRGNCNVYLKVWCKLCLYKVTDSNLLVVSDCLLRGYCSLPVTYCSQQWLQGKTNFPRGKECKDSHLCTNIKTGVYFPAQLWWAVVASSLSTQVGKLCKPFVWPNKLPYVTGCLCHDRTIHVESWTCGSGFPLPSWLLALWIRRNLESQLTA